MTASQALRDEQLISETAAQNMLYKNLFKIAYTRFIKIIKKKVIFNSGFILLAFIELSFFSLALPFFARSAVLAFILALLFLTGFSYIVLRQYLQAKTEEAHLQLREEFIKGAKNIQNYQNDCPADKLRLSQITTEFTIFLTQKEYHLYSLPSFLDFFNPFMQRLSCSWHWQDILQMQEQLLFECVKEHMDLIKLQPTNLHIHASIASLYVLLCTLYQPSEEIVENSYWIPGRRFSPAMKERFQSLLSKAEEEFVILNAFAPNDPNIHTQLANHYHTLQMPMQEIQSLERALSLLSEDKEILYKLGVLYFQQGLNAKGLQIYEKLSHLHPPLAALIITHYGSFDFNL